MTTHATNTDTGTATAGQDWRARAACAAVDVDAELFFPAAETGPVYDAQVAAAKAVCARCPVVAECLSQALIRIPYGIAGALTEDERRALRRRDRQTVAGVRRAVVAVQRAGIVPDRGRAA